MTALLIVLAIVLVFVIFVLVARTTELISSIKGKESSEANYRVHGNLALVFVIGGFILMGWSLYFFWSRFLPESASAHGHLIDNNFMVSLAFTGIVFVATQVLLFWYVFRYRYRRGAKAYFFPDNNKLEITWTVIPAIVLTILVVKGITNWYSITGPAPADAMEIEATGKQFEWMIRYPGPDETFGPTELSEISATNPLGILWDDETSRDDFIASEIVLPVDQPVKVNIHALDVLHSFFLPHFRVKMDAVPGIPTTFWFTPVISSDSMKLILADRGDFWNGVDDDNEDGTTRAQTFTYELACAELCGPGHSAMRKVVRIVSREEYETWMKDQKKAYDVYMESNLPESNVEAQGEDNTTGGDTEPSAVDTTANGI